MGGGFLKNSWEVVLNHARLVLGHRIALSTPTSDFQTRAFCFGGDLGTADHHTCVSCLFPTQLTTLTWIH